MGVNQCTNNYRFDEHTGEWYYINECGMKQVKEKERNKKRRTKQDQSIKNSWKDTLKDTLMDIYMDMDIGNTIHYHTFHQIASE